MKKMLGTILLTTLMSVSLAGCGSGEKGPASPEAAKPSGYPEKPIVIVAPSGAGGGWDMTARSTAKILYDTKLVDQTITVENRPGGGGAVFLAEYMAKDTKNPYKLFVSSPPIIIDNNKKEGNNPYGYRDVTPLAQLTKDFGAFVVRSDSPIQDMQGVIDAVKNDPTKVTIAGGSSPGSMDHLIAILPLYKSGVDPKSVKYVSYEGGGEAMTALLGGNADVIATDASGVGEYMKAGNIRVLAVTSPERLSGELASIPTLKELGLDAEFTIWRGLFGPKEMPKEALAYWDEKLKALSEKPEWHEELKTRGWEAQYLNSEQFVEFLGEQDQLITEMLKALDMAK
ncbi:tripartite tricarboxylate transporter substrate binding protein [Brevibacillus composti]|uniref:Tripartite tricarboxylate transporter substrate binding protein n=1 Tax=Brevibacillus composti TaxID=2796470 RepID=A0A7T5EP32_9BACL|nr:tripartite tricarboxylate transporter substrate binding protein [Brevibacillus composti]QQE76107.1 tripartite tricarboxylate transporter substrate binding protein [Brevibacillus composti]QUO43136.1 tripartite tricarboxylate transporter substrate binding protein [Brevibacillus composti]